MSSTRTTGSEKKAAAGVKAAIILPVKRRKKAVSKYLKDTREIESYLKKDIINAYIQLIRDKKLACTKLAYHITGEKIFMWVEIEENDLQMKGKFYLAGAEINALYYENTDIYLDTMVVNKRHGFAIPEQYHVVATK